MLVGIAVLPLLIRTLGLERYGFLTLVWVLVGYASIFDFGIGRVLVRVVALRLARGDVAGAHHMARVGLTFLALFGLGIGAAFVLGSNWLIAHVFTLPPELHGEALHAMWFLGASLPLVMLTTGYIGVLSAHQCFRGQNLARAVLGVLSYVAPLLVALWSRRLDAVVAVTLLTRLVGAVAYDLLVRGSCGLRFIPVRPNRASTRELIALGGWVTVSNIVAPVLTYLDRLLLGALVPIRMVAFYATPFDLLGRAMVLPQALMNTLFPSAAAVEPGSDAARLLMLRTARLLFALVLPLVFVFITLAHPGLRLWLGDEFAVHSAPVLQVLAVGVFFNILAQAPALLIQAAGQPRVMALLHLAELPIFVVLLYGLTLHFGILGTAIAATVRNGIDAVAVLWLARCDVARGALSWRAATLPALMALLLLCAALWPSTLAGALITIAVGLCVFAIYAWHHLLELPERHRLLRLTGLATLT